MSCSLLNTLLCWRNKNVLSEISQPPTTLLYLRDALEESMRDESISYAEIDQRKLDLRFFDSTTDEIATLNPPFFSLCPQAQLDQYEKDWDDEDTRNETLFHEKYIRTHNYGCHDPISRSDRVSVLAHNLIHEACQSLYKKTTDISGGSSKPLSTISNWLYD